MQNQNDRDLLAAILLKRDDEGHESWDMFHANLAQAVLDSDWLAARDAEKWDEGRQSVGLDFARRPNPDGTRTATPNPYGGGGRQ